MSSDEDLMQSEAMSLPEIQVGINKIKLGTDTCTSVSYFPKVNTL